MDTTQLLKGVLDLAVLAVVRDEDGYGYDIVRRLRQAGLEDVGDASVYGTLRRLYQAGALKSYVVASEEGPHRKYYGVTPAGHDTYETWVKKWRGFADAMEALIESDWEGGSVRTATSEATSEADRYLKEVAPHLAALPAEERADLLEDLALHLREVAAEPGPPLEERLGPPAAYAAELLATAGYPPPPVPRGGAAAAAASVAARLRRSAAGRELVRAWPSLRPAWWVARAWLAVYLLADLGDDTSLGFPVPALFGNPLVGLIALAVAIPASIRLGQRTLTGFPRAVAAANGVLLIYGLVLAGQVDTGSGSVKYVGSDVGPERFVTDSCLRNGDGSLITNLYAYDAEGRLLDPVLLYDQYGRPLDNLCPEFDDQGRRLTTEYRRDANGAPVINAFPRKQAASVAPPFDRKPSATVPVGPPAVVVPRLAPTTTVPTTAVPTTAVP